MLILYASYQTGNVIPEYVKFALRCLSACGDVTLLTNERTLNGSEIDFLKQNKVSLFFTENRGFDFGMWRRYLKAHAELSVNRLVLLNDSIVYYQNNFQKFFDRAEHLIADAVSLTKNFEVEEHLQSFFLYLKGSAIEAFKNHVLITPEQLEFYGAVSHLEIPFLRILKSQGLKGEALFYTNGNPLFHYSELMLNGAGFVKRKLLQRRFTLMEQRHFVLCGAKDTLYTDYLQLVKRTGFDKDFKLEWLPKPAENIFKRIFYRFLLSAYAWAKK